MQQFERAWVSPLLLSQSDTVDFYREKEIPGAIQPKGEEIFHFGT